jgi:hypothetical protein
MRMRKRTGELVHDTFSFSFLSLLGIDELRTGVLGWGVSVSLSFLSPPVKAGVLVLIGSSSWVVARSFRYSFCLFFFLFPFGKETPSS